jgi:hypothetical protein
MMRWTVVLLAVAVTSACSSDLQRALKPPARTGSGGTTSPRDCATTRTGDHSGLNFESGNLGAYNAVWVCGPSLAFAVGYVVDQYDGHRWTTVGLSDSSFFTGVWGSSGHDVYVVSNNMWHFDGTTWHKQPLPIAVALTAVWGTGPKDVYAVGDVANANGVQSGVILHNDGSGWTVVQQGQNFSYLSAVWGTSPSDVWVVGESVTSNLVMHGSAATGFAVDPVTGTVPTMLKAVWADSGNLDVWAVGDQTILHHTAAGWTSIPTGERVLSVWGRSATEVYMTTVTDAILEHNAGGLSYVIPPGNPNSTLHYPISGDPSTIVATTQGTILQNSGSGWVPYAAGSLAAIWLSDDTHGWAVGDGGRIVQGTGTSWSDVTPVSSAALTAVWGSSARDVYAVGAGGTVLHTSGTGWAAITTSASDSLNGVWGSGARDVWIVGASGTILHGGGSTWAAMTSGTNAHLRSVSGSGPSDVWVVGDAGTILHYDGSAWSAIPSGVTAPLVAVWMNSATDGWAVGPWNGVPPTCFDQCFPTTPVYLHYDGHTWNSFAGTGAPLALWFQTPTNGWVVGDIPGPGGFGTLYQFNGSQLTYAGFVAGIIQRPIRGVYGTADGNVYFVGANGMLDRYEP